MISCVTTNSCFLSDNYVVVCTCIFLERSQFLIFLAEVGLLYFSLRWNTSEPQITEITFFDISNIGLLYGNLQMSDRILTAIHYVS